MQVEEDSASGGNPEEEEAEWSFDPADYQQLMEDQQMIDPIVPNYLDYKDYKEDYYPEA